ncbi:MAG TPA: hypothetical protein VMF06_23445, partial [Candidatus Limnocylindria bacterium]|nr:hypothetical protein [Candidatus Limnocylindria bacterium]
PNGISRDGKFVAFTSTSRDLTVDKTSEFQDIFLADLSQRSIRRISRPFGGMPETKGNAFGAQITPDGRYILYESPRTNLLELPPPAGLNIYRYDTHTGTTILVSQDDRPDAYASPTMSSDGRFVLYENDQLMILRDVQEGVSSHPYAGKIFPHSPCVISADGSTIAFNTSGRISYLKTHNNSTFQIPASTTLHPAQAALLSPEGGKAVFADGSSNILYVANLATNGVASYALAGISRIGAIAMTPDATHIVMEARLDPAISGDYQIVLFDTVTESTTVLSTNKLGQPARGSSRAPSISADGLLVTFKSDASDLVDGDGNGTQEVFLRSQRSGRIELISHNGFQRAAADRSVRAALSADGSTAILLSAASDLNGSYFNGFNQLFAATLDTITDADTDRLPDEWERLHFGDLAQPSTGDPDHDGATNYEEYLAGTDPLDPNSILRLNLMNSADGNAELIWNGVEGIHYQVQIASSLQSNLWSDLGISLGGSQETVRVPISPPVGGSIFYRLLIVR